LANFELGDGWDENVSDGSLVSAFGGIGELFIFLFVALDL
jgi:hypothetical protein